LDTVEISLACGTLKEVIGNKSAKAALKEAVLWPIFYSQHFMSARKPSKGVLSFGVSKQFLLSLM